MSPLWSLLWSLVRALVGIALGWLVAKGYVTADQAQSATPELVSLVVMLLASLLIAVHSQWQKWSAGVFASQAPKTISSLSPLASTIQPSTNNIDP